MDNIFSFWLKIKKYKYLIVVGVFLLIVGFLDDNSLWNRSAYHRQIADLELEIAKYRSQYNADTRKLNELNADSCSIEKVAREHYLMKKADEDIYVFEKQ